MLFIHVALIKPTAINPFFKDRDPWHWWRIKPHAFQWASLCFCESPSTFLRPIVSISSIISTKGHYSSSLSDYSCWTGICCPASQCVLCSIPASATVRFWAPAEHSSQEMQPGFESPLLISQGVLCLTVSVGTRELWKFCKLVLMFSCLCSKMMLFHTHLAAKR